MNYTMENSWEKGNRLLYLRDATGYDWPDVLEFDDETGRILKQKRLPDGAYDIDGELGEVRREEVFAPLPLSFAFEKFERQPGFAIVDKYGNPTGEFIPPDAEETTK